MSVRRCFECQDIGFIVKQDGSVIACWRAAQGAEHNAPNDAAQLMALRVEIMAANKIKPLEIDYRVAAMLTQHTTAYPADRVRLVEAFFGYTHDKKRQLAKVIERLKEVWLLPIGSRKEPPSGYWICTTLDDFAECVARAKSAPITQLTTIHRMARANFPVLAEQLGLEFWSDIKVAEIPEVA